jgi:DNA-binding XRE family transcriptional regulator
MFVSILKMFGDEKHWPDSTEGGFPLSKSNLAKRAGVSTRTFKNAISNPGKASKTTIEALCIMYSSLIKIKITTDDISSYLNYINTGPIRITGDWEMFFRSSAFGRRIRKIKNPFKYSRSVIVPQERAANQYIDRLKSNDIEGAMIGLFYNGVNHKYIFPIDISSIFSGEIFNDKTVKLNVVKDIYIKIFIRHHVSGMAALEAENNSKLEKDIAPVVGAYMPIMKGKKLEGSISRYFTETMASFGIKSDAALSLELAKRNGGDSESWRRQILRWRKNHISSEEKKYVPEWESIEKIIRSIEAGEYRRKLLILFAISRYFQVVLESVLYLNENLDSPKSNEEIVSVFGEYSKWYSYHSVKIQELAVNNS